MGEWFSRTRTPPRNGLINRPVVIDPQQEIAERNRKISEEMRLSNDVAQARMMGFDNDVIKQALKRLNVIELISEANANFIEKVFCIFVNSLACFGTYSL